MIEMTCVSCSLSTDDDDSDSDADSDSGEQGDSVRCHLPPAVDVDDATVGA